MKKGLGSIQNLQMLLAHVFFVRLCIHSRRLYYPSCVIYSSLVCSKVNQHVQKVTMMMDNSTLDHKISPIINQPQIDEQLEEDSHFKADRPKATRLC